MTATADRFFGEAPAGELPDVPTEVPRHRGDKRPWIRKPGDAGPPPAVTRYVHRDGTQMTVLADPKDSKRGTYNTRSSSYGSLLDDKHKIYRARERRIAWAFGRYPELVKQAQALGALEDERDALEALADKAAEYGRGDAASATGTAFHRLRERRDQGDDLHYLDPLTLAGLDTWTRLLEPFELVGSEQFVVNDELGTAGTYDALLKAVRTMTIRDKAGNVLGAVEAGEAVVGDLKSGKWGPEWFGVTYGCQALTYATSVPYTHALGRYDWAVTPSTRWAVIPYVSLERLGDAGLHWIDLDVAREAAELVPRVKAARSSKSRMFLAHQPEPMPADLREAGERAVLLDDNYRLEDRIRVASGPAELSRLWEANREVWMPEHTAAGQARLAQLAGGAR